jgi:hypothetical protein
MSGRSTFCDTSASLLVWSSIGSSVIGGLVSSTVSVVGRPELEVPDEDAEDEGEDDEEGEDEDEEAEAEDDRDEGEVVLEDELGVVPLVVLLDGEDDDEIDDVLFGLI